MMRCSVCHISESPGEGHFRQEVCWVGRRLVLLWLSQFVRLRDSGTLLFLVLSFCWTFLYTTSPRIDQIRESAVLFTILECARWFRLAVREIVWFTPSLTCWTLGHCSRSVCYQLEFRCFYRLTWSTPVITLKFLTSFVNLTTCWLGTESRLSPLGGIWQCACCQLEFRDFLSLLYTVHGTWITFSFDGSHIDLWSDRELLFSDELFRTRRR